MANKSSSSSKASSSKGSVTTKNFGPAPSGYTRTSSGDFVKVQKGETGFQAQERVSNSSGGGGSSSVTPYDLLNKESGVSSLSAAREAVASTGGTNFVAAQQQAVAIEESRAPTPTLMQASEMSIQRKQETVSLQNAGMPSVTNQIVVPTTIPNYSPSPINNSYVGFSQPGPTKANLVATQQAKIATPINQQSLKSNTYSQLIKEQQSREQKFYSSEGLKRIEQTASLLTGGQGKPINQRSEFGYQSQKLVSTTLSFPITAGGYAAATGEKIALTVQGLANKDTRSAVKQELFVDAPRKVATLFNPKTREGRSTYIAASVLALPETAGKVVSGQTGFGVPKAKISYAKLDLPTEKGTVNAYQGFSLEIGKSAQPLIGSSGGRLVAGTPKVDLKQASFKKGFLPETLTQSKIIKENIGSIYKGAEAKKIELFPEVLKKTETVSSKFLQKKFMQETKTLSPAGVKKVLEFAKKEDATVYGSFSARQQLPEIKGRVPADIDVQLKVKTDSAGLKTQKLVNDLIKLGEPVRVSKQSPTLIESKDRFGQYHHAVDIHAVDQPTDILNPSNPAKSAYGFSMSQRPIKIQGIKTMRLSEQGVRKGASIFTMREKSFSPELHRMKDVPDFFAAQETLLESRTFRSPKAEKALSELKQLYPKSLFKQPTSPKLKIYEPPKTRSSPPSRGMNTVVSSLSVASMKKSNEIKSFSPNKSVSSGNAPSFSLSVPSSIDVPSFVPSKKNVVPQSPSPFSFGRSRSPIPSPSPRNSPSPLMRSPSSRSPSPPSKSPIPLSPKYPSKNPYSPPNNSPPSYPRSPYYSRNSDYGKESPRLLPPSFLPLPRLGRNSGTDRSGRTVPPIKVYNPSLIGIGMKPIKLSKAKKQAFSIGQLSGLEIRPVIT